MEQVHPRLAAGVAKGMACAPPSKMVPKHSLTASGPIRSRAALRVFPGANVRYGTSVEIVLRMDTNSQSSTFVAAMKASLAFPMVVFLHQGSVMAACTFGIHRLCQREANIASAGVQTCMLTASELISSFLTLADSV